MLYIVSTPIGNLKDITLRALEVLKSVQVIAAEDTRHTRILTQHHQITTPLTSYYEHNKLQKADYLLNILKEGRDVALVTDAGTPGISDPGFHLIRLALENDIPLTVVPGACAFLAALTLSGLPSHRIIFEGFLPVKAVGRRKKLEQMKETKGTTIFYESPYRLLECLKDIAEVLSDPQVVIAREITKKFEEVRRGPASELLKYFSVHKPKGEFVVLLHL
jgi:16S rRNA (cytidine1402-2'-O)-methyltransferase